MGCKAVTPHLVSLASKYEDKPFHVVFMDCQGKGREAMTAYMKSRGVTESSPNFSVTAHGRHPKVKGNGYVPYYMVFDHTGKLMREHMCGSYHGGDGMGMVDWVEALLERAPAIYLGEEPFQHARALADAVSAKKNLPATVGKIEAGIAAGGDAVPELERLLAAVAGYRDRNAARAEGLLATDPTTTLPTLQKLAKELKGTAVGAPVDKRVAELGKSALLKDSIAAFKAFGKAKKSLAKNKPCKRCKSGGIKECQATCNTCKRDNEKAFAKTAAKLAALARENPDLPITATIEQFVSGLR